MKADVGDADVGLSVGARAARDADLPDRPRAGIDGRAVERCETALLSLDQAEEARRSFDRLGRSIA